MKKALFFLFALAPSAIAAPQKNADPLSQAWSALPPSDAAQRRAAAENVLGKIKAMAPAHPDLGDLSNASIGWTFPVYEFDLQSLAHYRSGGDPSRFLVKTDRTIYVVVSPRGNGLIGDSPLATQDGRLLIVVSPDGRGNWDVSVRTGSMAKLVTDAMMGIAPRDFLVESDKLNIYFLGGQTANGLLELKAINDSAVVQGIGAHEVAWGGLLDRRFLPALAAGARKVATNP